MGMRGWRRGCISGRGVGVAGGWGTVTGPIDWPGMVQVAYVRCCRGRGLQMHGREMHGRGVVVVVAVEENERLTVGQATKAKTAERDVEAARK